VHGKGTFKYDNVRIGMNSRLDTLQAAILLVKFKAFQEYELENVNKAAACYTAKLQDVVITPYIPKDYYSSWAQYTIILKSQEERDRLQAALKEKSIPTMIYYPTPMHAQTAFKDLGYKEGNVPVSEKLCQTVLSLPIHPYLTVEEIDTICMTIRENL
jgi:dTDP-4-amino-4,6-dideoxygalactose transaminase